MIVENEGIPIGYVQYYALDEKEYGIEACKEIATLTYDAPYAIDIFLSGEFCNHGLGTATLQLLTKLIFETTDCDILFIDPNALNKRAVRCYEKARFQTLGLMKEHDLYQGRLTDSVLMFIGRDMVK